MTDFQKQIQESIDQAAFKACGNFLMPVLMKAVEQLKAENLLLSDDRELYMRHRDILIDALRVVESHNGINTHYPIVYATTKQALRDVGEI